VGADEELGVLARLERADGEDEPLGEARRQRTGRPARHAGRDDADPRAVDEGQVTRDRGRVGHHPVGLREQAAEAPRAVPEPLVGREVARALDPAQVVDGHDGRDTRGDPDRRGRGDPDDVDVASEQAVQPRAPDQRGRAEQRPRRERDAGPP
jgi:hypothetical protein